LDPTCIVDPVTGNELASYGAWTSARLKSIDLGFPEVRTTTGPRSGAHGVTDSTRWFGSRAVTAEVWMPQPPDQDQAVDNLQACMNPALRLYLYVQRPMWETERRLLVRGATFTCPAAVMRLAQAGWVAADPLWEDSVESSITLSASGGATGGVSFPLSFPMRYLGGQVAGASTIDVGGTADASPVIDMYGPCISPMFKCIDTGEQISFPGLTLVAGQFLRVDVAARTAQLNGLADQSRYQYIDFVHSTWLTLAGGASCQVVFSPQSPGSGSRAVVTWRPRYI
jgi:hypothetical protein